MQQLDIIDRRLILDKEVTTYGDIENPLFLAKDVAVWIEYDGRTGQMLNSVDEDEKLMHKIYASGQIREMWFLTEDGLYEVLMQSRKPIAKEFKKRVKKLLKEIRLNKYKNPFKNLSPELQAIMAHDKQIQAVQKEIVTVRDNLIDFKDNAPLFNIECEELMKNVKRVATKKLGGYKSNAYKDKSIRSRVYTDIQQQIKRQFGLESYKAIKRCQLKKALEIINEYKLPFVLGDEISMKNTQFIFREVQ